MLGFGFPAVVRVCTCADAYGIGCMYMFGRTSAQSQSICHIRKLMCPPDDGESPQPEPRFFDLTLCRWIKTGAQPPRRREDRKDQTEQSFGHNGTGNSEETFTVFSALALPSEWSARVARVICMCPAVASSIQLLFGFFGFFGSDVSGSFVRSE